MTAPKSSSLFVLVKVLKRRSNHPKIVWRVLEAGYFKNFYKFFNESDAYGF